MTWRRVETLVNGLPPESGCKTSARDEMTPEQAASLPKVDGHGPWSAVEMRLADIIDQLGWVIFATYAAQGGKPKKPAPFPRPGVKCKPRARPASPAGHAYLDQLRRNRGAVTSGD